MANAENKTQANDASVTAFVAAVPDVAQRVDAEQICELMARISGEPAKMWGPSIIGFGNYHYKYESGREGDMCRIGFSPRKGKTVLYLSLGEKDTPEHLARLGKHKRGKGCLYIKRLSDVDGKVLEELVGDALAHMNEIYPEGKSG